MRSYTLQLARYFLGLRHAETTVTDHERAALQALASAKRCIVEVGVYEGATSAVLCAAASPGADVFLVDPYLNRTRVESWAGFSGAEYIARRATRRWRDQAHFVRARSLEAARDLVLPRPADLIFIDADHSYEAVRADFEAWSGRLAPDGMIAFHDSRRCDARPDLDESTGPVRLSLEIARGEHGSWELDVAADSLTAYRPTAIQ